MRQVLLFIYTPCLTRSLQVLPPPLFFSFPCNSLLLLRQCYNIALHLHTKKVLVLSTPSTFAQEACLIFWYFRQKVSFYISVTMDWKTFKHKVKEDWYKCCTFGLVGRSKKRSLRTLSKRQT